MSSAEDPKPKEVQSAEKTAARVKEAFELFKTTHTYQNMAQVCPAVSLETAFFFGFLAGSKDRED